MQEYEDNSLDILKKHLHGRALRPPARTNSKMRSIRISDEAYMGLQTVAQSMGYIHSGKGNVSLLLESIGVGTIQVKPAPLI